MLRENVIVGVFGALLFTVTRYAQDTSIRPSPSTFRTRRLPT
jgi:hypothetical protein